MSDTNIIIGWAVVDVPKGVLLTVDYNRCGCKFFRDGKLAIVCPTHKDEHVKSETTD